MLGDVSASSPVVSDGSKHDGLFQGLAGAAGTRPPRGRSPGVISGWPPSQVNGTPRLRHWEPHPSHLLYLSGSPRSQLGRVRDRHVAGGASRDPAEEWATGTPGAVGGPGGEQLVPSGIWVPRPWRQRPKGIQEAPGTPRGGGPAPPLSRPRGHCGTGPSQCRSPSEASWGFARPGKGQRQTKSPLAGRRWGPAVGTRGPRHGTVAGSRPPPSPPLCPRAAGPLGQVLGRLVTPAWGKASVPTSLAQPTLCSNQ